MASHSTLDDDDEDLLQQLSKEELEQLSEIIDPDNRLLPASDRMPDQTSKKPTGKFDKQSLKEYLKKQAKESKIGEDYVPFIKKGRSHHQQDSTSGTPTTLAAPQIPSEFDEVLKGLTEEEIAELASELGMHGLLNQAQSRGDEGASAKTVVAQTFQKALEDSANEPDLETTIEAVSDNDPSLTEVNLNNHTKITSEHIERLMAALEGTSHVEKLSLANIKFEDSHAKLLAEVMSHNATIVYLNLESNRLTLPGIKALMRALTSNTTLKELKLANQYTRGGQRLELEIAKHLEKNHSILKLGFSFTANGPRVQVEKYTMRNQDALRRKRQMSQS